MSTLYSEGVVLSHAPTMSADRSISLYTKELGKIRARIKAGRKTQSKLAGNAEPFSRGLFFFAFGKGGYTLIGVDPMTQYGRIKKNLILIGMASLCAESVHRLTQDQHPDARIYDLCISTFSLLNQQGITEQKVRLVGLWCIWNLLTILGSGFESQVCVRCRKALSQSKLGASLLRGGMVCAQCHQHVSSIRIITPEALKLFRLLPQTAPTHLMRVRAKSATLTAAEKFTDELYQFHLEEKSSALGFIRFFSAHH
ncbi:DNA repair protein RecO [Patescibacteria group bacterium]